MPIENFLQFLINSRKFVEHLDPCLGDDTNLISKTTRMVTFQIYTLIKQTYPDATARQIQSYEQEYIYLIDAIHRKYNTQQRGSYFSQPI